MLSAYNLEVAENAPSFASYSVGCTTAAGRENGFECTDFNEAMEGYDRLVNSGRYVSVNLFGWYNDDDYEELDGWMA